MPRAKQLPSGAWRVQLYLNGKRESITRDTEDEANYAALEIKLQHKRKLENITVGDAMDKYISSKDGVLAPSTIAGYKKIRRNYVQDLMDIPISALKQDIVQSAFNKEAKRIGAHGKKIGWKTQANIRGLLAATLDQYDLRFKITTAAKQKSMKELIMPPQIFEAIKGTAIELPCLLAMWLSFSISEIRGLEAKDVKAGKITIRRTITDVEGSPVLRDAVKAYERARQLDVPPYILGLIEQTDAWKKGSGKLVTLSGQAVYKRLKRLLEKNGLPHISFHDLRHVNASVMHMLNIPDKYAMERGGWKTDTIMKNVYQNTFSSERQEVDRKINSYFEGFIK